MVKFWFWTDICHCFWHQSWLTLFVILLGILFPDEMLTIIDKSGGFSGDQVGHDSCFVAHIRSATLCESYLYKYLYLYLYVYLYFISECSSVKHISYLPIYRCRLINLLKVLKQHQYFSPNDHHSSNATINLTIIVLQNFPGCNGRISYFCPFSHWKFAFLIEEKVFHWKQNWPKVAEAQKCVAALDVDKDGDFSNQSKSLNLILNFFPISIC